MRTEGLLRDRNAAEVDRVGNDGARDAIAHICGREQLVSVLKTNV